MSSSTIVNYSEDALALPIYLTKTQINQGGASLFYLLVGLVASFLVFCSLMALYKRTPQNIVNDRIDAERFIKNFYLLTEHLFLPDVNLKRIALGLSLGKLLHFGWLLIWLIAAITLQIGLSSIVTTDYGVGDYTTVQAGLVLYFIGLIGYFVTRALSYYRERLQVRKKIWIHRVEMLHSNSSTDTSSMERQKFDESFNYIRRIKHISPVFYKIKYTIFNFIQSFVLVTEFFQLVSFPMRDLFRNIQFLQSLQRPQGKTVETLIESLRALLASLSTGMVSVDYNYVKFVVAWWLTITALIAALLFGLILNLLQTETVEHWISLPYRKSMTSFVTGRWIVSLLPLVNLFYLILLSAFLEPLACFGSNSTPPWPAAFANIQIAARNRIYECYPIYTANPVVNTWFALLGFTLAFFLFTICRTAQEPIPESGIITYTSRSELFTKISSICLLLLYALLPTADSSTGRGSIAVIILFFMALYNAIIGSTNVRWINYLRSVGYVSIMWVCLVVTYFTSPSNSESLYQVGAGVFTVILIGWLVLWVLCYVIDFLFIRGWERRCAEEPPTVSVSTNSSHTSKKDVDSLEQTQISEEVVDIEAPVAIVPLPPRRVSTLAAPNQLLRANSLSTTQHPSLPATTERSSTQTHRHSLISLDGRESLRSSATKRVVGPRAMPESFSSPRSSVTERKGPS